MEAKFEIVVGEFALVPAGNGTFEWIINDENTQKRANNLMDSYFRSGSHDLKIHEIRKGAAIFFKGKTDGYAFEFYNNEESARQACERRGLKI